MIPSRQLQCSQSSQSSPPFQRLQLRTREPWQKIIPDLCLQLLSLIFLHVHNMERPPAWTVMDRGEFLCMQSQQSSTNYHSRYNKSTRADHAAKPSTGQLSPALRVAYNSYNSHNLQIILNFFPPFSFFPDLGFHIKIWCLSFSMLCIIFTHTLSTFLFSLVVRIDRLIASGKKSPPH